MTIDEANVKRIISGVINSPTVGVAINGKIIEVPCYKRYADYKAAPEYTQTKKFLDACEKSNVKSPNMVQSISIGSNGAVKSMFSKGIYLATYSRADARYLETATINVAKTGMCMTGIFSAMLKNKMNNVELLDIDSMYVTMALGNYKDFACSSTEQIIRIVNSREFGYALFGEMATLVELFPRLVGIQLGKIKLGPNNINSNWIVLGNTKAIKCDKWTVQEKVYEADEGLYKHVSKYMKENFNR